MPVKVQIDGLGIVEFDDAFRDMDEAQRQSVLAEVVEQQQQQQQPPSAPPMSDQGAADLKDKVENTPWYEALYHEVNKHRHNALFGMSEGVGELGSGLLNLFGANVENPLGAEKPSPLRDIAGLASGVTPRGLQNRRSVSACRGRSVGGSQNPQGGKRPVQIPQGIKPCGGCGSYGLPGTIR